MNYYERHLGDYARDTAHLSMLEHGAYNLLMDRYYATESGIPADQVHRAARARSRDEKAAVDAVLAEFFTLVDGAWRQRRCDAVISEYKEGEGDREAKRENAKERQRRARERRADLFSQLRSHGIVPDWDTSTAELHRALSRVTSQPVTPPVTRDDTATHSPDPDTSRKSERERGAGELADEARLPDGVDPERWRLYLDQLADDGKASISRHKLALVQLHGVVRDGHDGNKVLEAAVMRGLRDLTDTASRLANEAAKKSNGGSNATHRESAAERVARINADAEQRESSELAGNVIEGAFRVG